MCKSSLIQYRLLLVSLVLGVVATRAYAQNRTLTTENIDYAIRQAAPALSADSLRPAYHLTPPAGCMGDPNGGIYHDGWYHIFYGLHPFAFHPGGWYWAHARSQDLVHWEPLPNTLTPDRDLGLHAIGSGSTIITPGGEKLGFHSQSSSGGKMEFWQTRFTDEQFTRWSHREKPILTLDHPG